LARYTTPIAPAPIFFWIAYGPSRVPEGRSTRNHRTPPVRATPYYPSQDDILADAAFRSSFDGCALLAYARMSDLPKVFKPAQ
jgi:hypothetical protein